MASCHQFRAIDFKQGALFLLPLYYHDYICAAASILPALQADIVSSMTRFGFLSAPCILGEQDDTRRKVARANFLRP